MLFQVCVFHSDEAPLCGCLFQWRSNRILGNHGSQWLWGEVFLDFASLSPFLFLCRKENHGIFVVGDLGHRDQRGDLMLLHCISLAPTPVSWEPCRSPEHLRNRSFDCATLSPAISALPSSMVWPLPCATPRRCMSSGFRVWLWMVFLTPGFGQLNLWPHKLPLGEGCTAESPGLGIHPFPAGGKSMQSIIYEAAFAPLLQIDQCMCVYVCVKER